MHTCMHAWITHSRHEDWTYKTCVGNSCLVCPDIKIGHTKHVLETHKFIIKSLSPYNDKRWLQRNLNDLSIYSFGHKNIAI